MLSSIFENKTQWLNNNWSIAWKHDLIPSDFSGEYQNVYDFKAIAKFSIIAHRTMSALCKEYDLLFDLDNLNNKNKYNAKALKLYLRYHIYGTRLFAIENQKELIDFTSTHSFSISDQCTFRFFFIFRFLIFV